MRRSSWAVSVLVGGTVLVGGAISPALAQGAVYVVTSSADGAPDACNAECTLRDAINVANLAGSDDEVTFAPELAGQTTTLTNNEIDVANNGTLTITAPPGGYTVSGNNASRIFAVSPEAELTITGLTLSAGFVLASVGGAIANFGTLTIENSTFEGNSTNAGGAIYNGGTLTIENSTFEGNSTLEVGGAITSIGPLTIQNSTLEGNSSHAGGAIFNQDALTIENSTLEGNSAAGGGAIYNNGTIAIGTSTLSGNTALTSVGGTIVTNFNDVSLDSVTIAFSTGLDAVFALPDATLTAQNTIITNTTGGPNCGGPGTFTSAGHNLSSDETCFDQPSDLLNTDPLLEPLAANGGPSQTHALPPTSPAIDAGETALGADQRGVPRPQGPADDIGAYEREVPIPPSSTTNCRGTTVPKTSGSEGDDDLVGTVNADAIFGLGGNDELDGVDGNDCLDAGDGDDRASGGADDDLVKGGDGRDKVRGLGGKDRLKGQGAVDRVNGGEGKDKLSGGPGDDKLRGGAAKDRYKGNAGDDDLNAVDAKRDRVNCGGGDDKAVVDPVDRVSRNCETVREVEKD